MASLQDSAVDTPEYTSYSGWNYLTFTVYHKSEWVLDTNLNPQLSLYNTVSVLSFLPLIIMQMSFSSLGRALFTTLCEHGNIVYKKVRMKGEATPNTFEHLTT